MNYGLGVQKMVRYGQLLRAMMSDQIAWIHDRTHKRTITGRNGRDSLALAVRATQIAEG